MVTCAARIEYMPVAGNQPRRSASTTIRISPSQKAGVLATMSVRDMLMRSNHEYWRVPETMPTPRPTTTQMTRLPAVRSTVFQNFGQTSWATGTLTAMETPKSPCSTFPSQRKYCT